MKHTKTLESARNASRVQSVSVATETTETDFQSQGTEVGYTAVW